MSNKCYVYILSNPSMPGMVKIGKTTLNVEQREPTQRNVSGIGAAK